MSTKVKTSNIHIRIGRHVAILVKQTKCWKKYLIGTCSNKITYLRRLGFNLK